MRTKRARIKAIREAVAVPWTAAEVREVADAVATIVEGALADWPTRGSQQPGLKQLTTLACTEPEAVGEMLNATVRVAVETVVATMVGLRLLRTVDPGGVVWPPEVGSVEEGFPYVHEGPEEPQ